MSLLFCAWLGVCWCLIVRARNGPTHGPVHVTRFAATTGILFALCASSLYEHISLSEGSGANMLYVCIHMYAAYFLRAYHSVWVCVCVTREKKKCSKALRVSLCTYALTIKKDPHYSPQLFKVVLLLFLLVLHFSAVSQCFFE